MRNPGKSKVKRTGEVSYAICQEKDAKELRNKEDHRFETLHAGP